MTPEQLIEQEAELIQDFKTLKTNLIKMGYFKYCENPLGLLEYKIKTFTEELNRRELVKLRRTTS